MSGPAQKDAARGCGTLQEARHGGAPVVEHRGWCSRSCSGLRALGSSAEARGGRGAAHQGVEAIGFAAERGRRRGPAAAVAWISRDEVGAGLLLAF